MGLAPSRSQIDDLVATAKAINELKGAFTGLEVAIVTQFKDPLIAATNSLRDFLGETKKVLDYADTVGGAAAGAALGARVGGLPGAVVGGVVGGTVGVSGAVEGAKEAEGAWDAFKRKWDDIQEAVGHGRPSGTTHGSAPPAPVAPLATPEGTRRAEHESYGAAPAAAGEGKPAPGREQGAAGAVAHEIPVKQITEDLQKQLKALEDELKLKQAGLALDLEKARGDQAEIERIHARQQALEKDILTRKNAAVADAQSKSGGLVTADTTGNQAALINLETAALKEQHKAQDEARAAALAGLEADRRILAQAEAADLASVQRREKAGEITAEAASAAEQQIVAAHDAASGQILAKEAELAQERDQARPGGRRTARPSWRNRPPTSWRESRRRPTRSGSPRPRRSTARSPAHSAPASCRR